MPGRFTTSGAFVLRAPLLPFDELTHWGRGPSVAAMPDDADADADAIVRDRARLRERLRQMAARPDVRDALLVASPRLVAALPDWEVAPDTRQGRSIERSLVRYVTRMSTRPTPFGLFAGCAVGTVAASTRLDIAAADAVQRRTRLDAGVVDALARALAVDARWRDRVHWRSNPTRHRVAGRVRYIDVRTDGSRRTHHLVAVDETRAIRETLARAADGATRPQLVDGLVDDGAAPDAAETFVEQLIDSTLLLPDLALQLTGPEPLDGLIAQLQQLEPSAPEPVVLRRVRSALAALDAEGPGLAAERYRDIATMLRDLPIDHERPGLVATDVHGVADDPTVAEPVLDEIIRGVEVLERLAPSRDDNVDELDDFRDRFVARYGTREVPLIEALDAELGVGLVPRDVLDVDASPLLRGLGIKRAGTARPHATRHDDLGYDGTRHRELWRKLTDAAERDAVECVVEPSDIDEPDDGCPRLADAIAAVATIVAESAAAVDRGDFQVLIAGASGPSGARMLGRFCHGDPAVRACVDTHLRREEALDPDAVFAEIVHLPEGAHGNVLARPVLRQYEITYLGRSGAAADRQIPVSDLLLSVSDGQVRLRSATLERRVVPRLTSAHAYTRAGPGIYRFLCMLQSQGVTGHVRWRDGPCQPLAYRPRVRIGRIVLAPARWRIATDEIARLTEAGDATLLHVVAAWRRERRLPRLVTLADDRAPLVVDLTNLLSVESFVHLIRGRTQATLTEVLPAADALCARGPAGGYIHEIVVPLVRDRPARAVTRRTTAPRRRPQPLAPTDDAGDTPPRRADWLSVKLFTGAATADRVLLDAVGPLAHEAIATGAARRWFFIRHGDPAWHLRVRIHGSPDALDQHVVPVMRATTQRLLDEGHVWRVEVDTYQPEASRYGGAAGVDVAERIFHADSDAVVDIIRRLEPGDRGNDERWRVALGGVARLLSDLGLGDRERLTLTEQLRDDFAAEFGSDAALRRRIGQRFRAERDALHMLLSPAWGDDHPLASGSDILRRRSARIAPLAAELRALERAGTLQAPVGLLARSYVHMHVNRLIRAAQRAHELVLYDFLARMYRTVVVADVDRRR
jgi:thiopeptide-type bacteriocin biosynthesis protein